MKIEPRSNGIYQLRMPDGKRVSLGTRDRVLASQKAQDILAGRTRKEVTGSYTLGQALDRCHKDHWLVGASDKARRDSESKIRLIKRDLGADTPLRDITFERLVDYRNELTDVDNEDHVSPSTIKKRLSAISTALSWVSRLSPPWIQRRDLPEVPHVEVNNICPRCLTADEEAAQRAALDKAHVYIAALYDVLLDTGARLSEPLKLQPGDVDEENQTVTFRDTKNGKSRTVPLEHPRTLEALRIMLAEPQHAAGEIDTDWCWARWHQVREDSGVHVGFHVLRHTCATRLLRSGVDLALVSRWLGHSSTQVTMRYLQIVAEDLRTASRRAARTAHRPAQIVAPTQEPGGISMIINGLDYWSAGTFRTVNPLVACSNQARGANSSEEDQ